MSDEQQPMQQPVELRFLEMIRELPSELPDYLVRYQSEASAELRSFEENSNRVRGLNETRTFTPEAMVILFHHIAFETFKGFEKLYEQLNDEEDDPIFSDFASPARPPLLAYVRQGPQGSQTGPWQGSAGFVQCA
jgi:hypothetical protein